MNDCLVVYIERDVACSINNDTIMHRFQNMKTAIVNFIYLRVFLLLLLSIYEFLFLLDFIIYTSYGPF